MLSSFWWQLMFKLSDKKNSKLAIDWKIISSVWYLYFFSNRQVSAKGMLFHEHAYLKSGWNIMDGSLVFISLVDIMISFLASGSSRIFGILRVFRLLRALKPLRWVGWRFLKLSFWWWFLVFFVIVHTRFLLRWRRRWWLWITGW